MDFTLPEAGDDVRGLARDIASTISTPERVAELEATAAPIDADLWRATADAGLLGLELSSDAVGDAGGDLTAVENALVVEEFGRMLARIPFGAHAFTALPVIAARGSDALRAAVLAAGARGEKVVGVAAEEDLGVDLHAPATRLSATNTLTGVKLNVAYATAADLLLVTAQGADGPVVMAVPTDAPGVEITSATSTGLLPTAQVEFTDVAVDADHVLTGGADALTDLVDRLTLSICAEQAGIVAQALQLTADYAREREQFGRAIGSFQAVAQRLADGYIDVQGLSLTTTQAVWILATADTHRTDETDLSTAIATAKFWAAEAGHRVAHTTVHVHGGVGLDTSHPVHRYFLRAKQNEFTCGSATGSLTVIGDHLAGTPA